MPDIGARGQWGCCCLTLYLLFRGGGVSAGDLLCMTVPFCLGFQFQECNEMTMEILCECIGVHLLLSIFTSSLTKIFSIIDEYVFV